MPKLGDRTPMSERLLSKIDRQPNDGCWLWTGAKNGYGYGTLVTADLKKIRAHRAAFVEFKAEPLGPDDVVMHTCDVPACINPAHLVKGSKLTNNRDAKEKGRNAKHETNGRARLTEDQVAAIRECAGVLPQKLLARLAGIDASAISRIIAGLRWEP